MDYLATLVNELNIEKHKLVLVSPSMSGAYALPYVLKHPEMFAGFVPIAPVGSGLPHNDLRALQVLCDLNAISLRKRIKS